MEINKQKRIWNKFNLVSLILGLIPLLLFVFSDFFGKQNEYADYNHGPLHQYPGGEQVYNGPLDYFITSLSFWPPLLIALISVVIFVIYLIKGEFKLGLLYLVTFFFNLILLIIQIICLFWLID